jgi:hypothetical protein
VDRTILTYEPELDFALVAITSSLETHVLCFKLNRQLNISLCRIDELGISFREGDIGSLHFDRYFYQNSSVETAFYLLVNRGAGGFLVPEMKNVDFFLLIQNNIDEEDLKTTISTINQITEIIVAVRVDPKKVKSRENLIF